jgi:hypothetical protein
MSRLGDNHRAEMMDLNRFLGGELLLLENVAKLHPLNSSLITQYEREGYHNKKARELAQDFFRDDIVLKEPYKALIEIANYAPDNSLYIHSIAAVFTSIIHQSNPLNYDHNHLLDELKKFTDDVLDQSDDVLIDLGFTKPGIAKRIAQDLNRYFINIAIR